MQTNKHLIITIATVIALMVGGGVASANQSSDDHDQTPGVTSPFETNSMGEDTTTTVNVYVGAGPTTVVNTLPQPEIGDAAVANRDDPYVAPMPAPAPTGEIKFTG